MTSRDPVVAYDVTRNLVEHGSITVIAGSSTVTTLGASHQPGPSGREPEKATETSSR